MRRTKALVLVVAATVGCGGGRSLLFAPPADSTNTDPRTGPDASRDVLLSRPDTGPTPPDVVREDARPFSPDMLIVIPEVGPDTVKVPPPRPDAGPDVSPPPADTKSDLLPLPSDAKLDLQTPPFDAKPDVVPLPFDVKLDSLPPPLDLNPDLLNPDLLKPDLPPPPPDARPDLPPVTPDLARPDLRPIPPDGIPPLQICVDGEACSGSCTTSCQSFGTRQCTCTNGVLACGACQPPNIHITLTPCPDKASGTSCDSSGLACPVYTNGSVTGACACLDFGGGLRWICL
jgi:hypothetical protein